MARTGRLVVGVTGASGGIYAIRFLQQATQHFREIYYICTDQALQVMQTELGMEVSRETLCARTLLGYEWDGLRVLDPRDYFSPPASGSFRHDGMVIIPCSMGTLGRIANGISDDLMTRAADVCLKERRPLILVVRETPFNLVHLRNMVRAAEAGAVILPANPAFYHRPTTLEEAVDTVIARVLQHLGVEQHLVPEWGTEGD
ncbi:MAG: UbiX family flavin prenyltransferase [Fimbriimonadales bacterium]|nr:UbiX family flavin prenyltransferase [Fimbriimonadales bacterium]MDW8050995.1 flavin prenyltransferase UbiX [Armatimonadota bacterium]